LQKEKNQCQITQRDSWIRKILIVQDTFCLCSSTLECSEIICLLAICLVLVLINNRLLLWPWTWSMYSSFQWQSLNSGIQFLTKIWRKYSGSSLQRMTLISGLDWTKMFKGKLTGYSIQSPCTVKIMVSVMYIQTSKKLSQNCPKNSST
jgi:hypothetical protein